MRPRILDLCCGAGGAAMGYSNVGFNVIGVDITDQPRFPFEFLHEDALGVLRTLLAGDAIFSTKRLRAYWLADFDAIHASFPCQRHSQMSNCRPGLAETYPDLIGPGRELLDQTGLPWVMENVPGSPLDPDATVTLCGHMFGLPLYRHRLFETNFPIYQPEHPEHVIPASKAGHWKPGTIISVSGHISPIKVAREAMGIDWTNREELAEAIPPTYTEYIGEQLLKFLYGDSQSDEPNDGIPVPWNDSFGAAA